MRSKVALVAGPALLAGVLLLAGAPLAAAGASAHTLGRTR